MYRHFGYIHPKTDITNLDDGVLDKCGLCGMCCNNLQKHQAIQTCKKLSLGRKHEVQQNAQAEANDVVFMVNGKAVEEVKKFKYLG